MLMIAQLLLPRRYGFVPLVAAALHIGNVEFIGELTIHRALIIIGIIRAIAGGFFRFSISSPLDLCFIVFALVALFSAGFHNDPIFNPYVAHTGLVLNVCGTYLYGKSYLSYNDWPQKFAFFTAILTIPLGTLMYAEAISAKNYYSVIGTTHSGVIIRDGDVRARGPFGHPILGGTAGGTSFALCVILWQSKRKIAIAGMLSSFAIVISSASSGPLMALMISIAWLLFWRKRVHVKKVPKLAVLMCVALELLMERPFYYIIAHIDLTGGSTSWHRCRLMEMGIKHFDEWWLAGTDFTRHWMPTGVSWNPNHTDITNYYLHLGVIGGVFLLLTLVGIIFFNFRTLFQRVSPFKNENSGQEFIFWCLSASLLSHIASFISISYFDQMYVLFYLLIAGIGSFPDLFPRGCRHENP